MHITVLICAALLCGAARSRELGSLYGVRGGNRATMCMAPGVRDERCDAAIWSPNWLLVRGGCVAGKPMYPVIIFRNLYVPCDAVAPDRLTGGGQRVRARFLHPAYPAVDYALISFTNPYWDLEPDRNDSVAIINKLQPWLRETTTAHSPTVPRRDYAPDEANMSFSSPLKMFLATAVLPLTLFIVMFVVVTFYTGKGAVPYTILNDNEDPASA